MIEYISNSKGHLVGVMVQQITVPINTTPFVESQVAAEISEKVSVIPEVAKEVVAVTKEPVFDSVKMDYKPTPRKDRGVTLPFPKKDI